MCEHEHECHSPSETSLTAGEQNYDGSQAGVCLD